MKLTATLLAGTLITGCGMVDDASDKAKKQTGIAPELVSEWKADCYDASVLDLSKAERLFDFGPTGNFEKKEYLYLGDDCRGDAAVEYSFEGSYSVKGENENNKDIENIEYTIEKAYLKIASGKAIDLMNSAEVCGIDEWRVDERVEITDKDCGPFKVEKDTIVYDTYQINGDNLLVGGGLFVGNLNTSVENRPESVDEGIRHAKQ